jgi:hypothetical protein
MIFDREHVDRENACHQGERNQGTAAQNKNAKAATKIASFS